MWYLCFLGLCVVALFFRWDGSGWRVRVFVVRVEFPGGFIGWLWHFIRVNRYYKLYQLINCSLFGKSSECRVFARKSLRLQFAMLFCKFFIRFEQSRVFQVFGAHIIQRVRSR